MKVKVLASALCLCVGLTLSAQNKSNKGNRQDKEPRQFPSEKMIQDLNLSEKQVIEWKELHESNMKAKAEAREQNKENKTTLTKEEREAKAQERKAARQAEVQKILTPEQFAKFEELKKDKKECRKGDDKRGQKSDKRKGDRMNKEARQFPSEKMIQDLNLSDKQVAEWKELRENNMKERKELREQNKANNVTLTKEEREAKALEMRTARQAELQKILTPDQFAKFEELKKDKGSDKNHSRRGDDKGRKGNRKDGQKKDC